MSKNKYSVTIPFAGTATIEIEADNEKEAEELAFDKVNFRVIPDTDDIEIENVQTYKRFTQGNVCYVWNSEVEINLIENDNEQTNNSNSRSRWIS